MQTHTPDTHLQINPLRGTHTTPWPLGTHSTTQTCTQTLTHRPARVHARTRVHTHTPQAHRDLVTGTQRQANTHKRGLSELQKLGSQGQSPLWGRALCFPIIGLDLPWTRPWGAAQADAGDHRSPIGCSASLASEGYFQR